MSDARLSYRFLGPQEWSALVPLVNRRRLPLPHPQLSTAAVALHAEQVVAAWFLQLVPHMEPLIVMPGWEGHASLDRLYNMLDERAKAMERFSRGYLIHATTDEQFRTLTGPHAGMHEIPGRLLGKEFAA